MDIKRIQTWLSGEMLRSDFVRKQYKVTALAIGLLFIYILAGYNSARQQRRLNDIKREVKMAKFEYLAVSAQLAEQTRQSKIYDKLQAAENKSQENSGRKSVKLQENRVPVIQLRQK